MHIVSYAATYYHGHQCMVRLWCALAGLCVMVYGTSQNKVPVLYSKNSRSIMEGTFEPFSLINMSNNYVL